MKKIAFLLDWFPDDKGKTFETYHMINAIDAGYDIRIFPRYLHKLSDASQPEIIERYHLMEKVIKPTSYYSVKWLFDFLRTNPRKRITYLIRSLNPLLFGMDGIILFVFHKISLFHGNLDFDIFHCQYGPNGLIAAWLKELGLFKGKVITTFHGYDAQPSAKHLWRAYFYSSITTWSPVFFRHMDLITVNTPYLSNQVIRLGADSNKIELLPMGVDTAFFKPGHYSEKENKIRLISVGRTVKWKGHDLGIEAVKNLVTEGFNLEYFIIGDGPERDNLQKLAEGLNLKRNVRLLGFKNQSEIKKYLQGSDIFLMTSVYDEIGRRETQGVVTAEAQACGLPVVAFRSGGIPYTIEEGKTGFLAEEKNVAEFTHQLRKLCANDTLRKKMGQNARIFVEENFSNTKLVKRQISLYEKVLLET